MLAYDMTDDKRRAKIARLMESFGERVQSSVFEAYLTRPELDKLLKKARKVLDEDNDSLRIYYLCQACRQKTHMEGKSQLTTPPGVMIL